MINPKDFVNVSDKINKEEVVEDVVNVTGTFICQNCLEPIGFAVLNEDTMTLTYTCAAGHENEATL